MTRIVLALVVLAAAGCKRKADPVERLLRDLESPEVSTRSIAADRLGEIRGLPALEFHEIPIGAGPLPLGPREARIVEALNQMMIHDDAPYGGANLSAAVALARLRPPGLQPGLVHCVVNDPATGGTCMHAIVKIATPDVLAELLPLTLLTRDRGPGRVPVSDVVSFHLRETGPAVLPAVRAVIEADEDSALIATLIVELLRRWTAPAPEGAAELLLLALRSQFAEVRYRTLTVLEANGFELQRAEVAGRLEDPDLDVRTKAAAMLEGRNWNRAQGHDAP